MNKLSIVGLVFLLISFICMTIFFFSTKVQANPQTGEREVVRNKTAMICFIVFLILGGICFGLGQELK